MLFINLILFAVSFFLIWVGSGFIVSSTGKFTEKLKLSSFAFSFIFLGLLTSIPEFSVGLQSIADNDPEIFVGNLIGGIAVIFLFVIPVLAIFGNGVNLKNELDNRTTIAILAVIALPSLFVLDKRISNFEGIIFILSYILLVVLVERKNGIFDKENNKLLNSKSYSYKDILKILMGIGLVFISSSIIVDKTNYFAELFSIPTFYLGLIIVSLGTNLPEISIAIRSVVSGKKDVAMGDYMGSAAANTLLFGIFTLLVKGEVVTVDNFIVTFMFIILAVSIFYILFRKKQFVSRRNGIIMLIIYFIFISMEILT